MNYTLLFEKEGETLSMKTYLSHVPQFVLIMINAGYILKSIQQNDIS